MMDSSVVSLDTHRATVHGAGTGTQATPHAVDTPETTLLPLHVENLVYAAGGGHLVDGLTFNITAGDVTVIVGPNGAGKSLTLRLLHGLLRPTQGRVLWNGQKPDRSLRRRQAMVFQKPVLLRRTVAANVRYALRVHGVGRDQRHARTAEVLTAAGLGHLAGRAARVLSGGEQQRLALARAWAVQPEVLFLDEPSANLDPTATHHVETLIREIRNQGTKIILTTHDMGQARRLGDEVLFLHHGQIQERAPATRFFAKPESMAAQAYLEGRLPV